MHYKPYIENLPAYKSAKLVAQQPQEIVKLSSNENVLGPSPRALATMQQVLAGVHRYPDGGASVLRQALATRAGLQPDAVICSNGSDELVLLLCMAFLNQGDEVVMAHGTFISYLLRSLAVGATPVRVPLRDYVHDLDALVDAITPRTKMLFVCNPNNPTGTTNGAAEIRQLIERVPEHVLIVVDEAYLEYATRADYPDLLPHLRDGRMNLLLMRTFAKIYGLAGLRLGYAYAAPEVIAYLDRARPVFNVNTIAQVAGVAALDDSEHIAHSRAHAAASRAFYEAKLSALGLTPVPSETNFIAVEVQDDVALADNLREHGFAVNPLSGWGLPGLLRISFGTEDENKHFIQALRTVLGQA